MALFSFKRLLKKYSVDCELEIAAGGGSYIGGNWVPGEPVAKKGIKGAKIPMTDQKVYQSGGTYTTQDCEFLTATEIPLEPEAYIICKGKRFKVAENSDYDDYADFCAYNLKRVSGFDRSEKS